MVRFGKYTPLVCILSALVILEFAGLVGVLLENGGLRAQLEAVQREAAGEREPDGDQVLKLARQKLRGAEPTRENLKKVSDYLARRGYGWDEISGALGRLREEEWE